MPSEQGFLTGLLVMWMASGDGRYSKSLSTQRPPFLTASGTPSPSKSMVSPSSGKPWSGKASPGLAPLGRVGDGLRSLSRTFHPAAMAILTAASMASGCFRACCKWGSAWTAARNSSLVAADMGGSQSRSDASMVPVATVLGPSVWPKPKPLPQTPRPRMKRAWLRSFLTPRPSTRSMPGFCACGAIPRPSMGAAPAGANICNFPNGNGSGCTPASAIGAVATTESSPVASEWSPSLELR